MDFLHVNIFCYFYCFPEGFSPAKCWVWFIRCISQSCPYCWLKLWFKLPGSCVWLNICKVTKQKHVLCSCSQLHVRIKAVLLSPWESDASGTCLERSWGRSWAPFHCSPVAGAHRVALSFEGLRKIQWKCLTLDEQSVPRKSSCDINSKNLLESKVVVEAGIEVAYENNSKTASANTDFCTVSTCIKVAGFLNLKSVGINTHFSTFSSWSLHKCKMASL